MTTKTRDQIYWVAVITLALILATAKMVFSQEVSTSYTIDAAIERALAVSKGLKLTEQQVDEAEGLVRESRAGFMPRLDVQAGYFYKSDTPELELNIATPIGPIQRTMDLGKNDNWNVKAQLTQPVFLGGAVYYANKAAKYGVESACHSRKSVQNDLVNLVTKNFYSIILAQETKEVLKLSLDNAQAHLADVKRLQEAGAASRVEVLQAEVQVNMIVPKLSQAQEALERSTNAMQVLLDLPSSVSVELVGQLKADAYQLNPDEVQTEALENRPELAGIEMKKLAAVELVKSARAGWLPKLQAQASYNYEQPFFVEDQGDYFLIGAGIQIPLFEGLGTLAKMDQYKAKARQADIALAMQTDQIRLEINDSITRLDQSAQRARYTEFNIALADEALEITREGYREGAATNLDVLDSNLRLMQARLENILAAYDHEIALNDLDRARGRYAKQGDDPCTKK